MEKFRVKINGLKCLRCGYEWKPHNEGELPVICPNRKCKSPFWKTEKKNKKAKT